MKLHIILRIKPVAFAVAATAAVIIQMRPAFPAFYDSDIRQACKKTPSSHSCSSFRLDFNSYDRRMAEVWGRAR
jgi:hypothetical protein